MKEEKYSETYFQNIKQLCISDKSLKNEALLRDFCKKRPYHVQAKLELASLLLTSTVSDRETYKERRIEGLDILEGLINNPHVSSDEKNEAKILKARHLSTLGYFLEAYEIYYNLANTNVSEEAYYGMAVIEAHLGDIESAKRVLESYKGRYTQNSRIELCRIAIAEGDMNAAYKYLYKLRSNRSDNVLREQVFVEFRQGNYAKALEIYTNTKFSKYGKRKESEDNLILYLKYKLGQIDPKDFSDNYFMNQLVDYDVCRTKRYINSTISKERDLCLYEFIRLDDIIPYAQDMIADMKPYRCELSDFYIIRCENMNGPFNIGSVKRFSTDSIKVGTLPGTKSIITLKPVDSIDMIRSIVESNHGPSRKK